ncbi:MAG TPA: LuxR C-terminal-related transcriptional regulator, partial [Anaerolineales bacterium]|nr:LuxR C-terminal-related transcriptional regulator [Anaerolineales bacterium]
VVPRPRLIARLNEGLAMGCRVTLISAAAGFGKTTLVSEWISALISSPSPTGRGSKMRAAWLSLDEGDNDPSRFISYFVAALQTIKTGIGEELLTALHASQYELPQAETILTALLNEISVIPEHFLIILDDYHSIDSQPVDQALAFLVEHQPPQMHLVIATREDPSLPLARLRVRGQLTEIRATDLRFTPAEAAEFINRMMGLNLSDGGVTALESRTEGWIAGLQMAALSMQGREDIASFIQAFTGSHRFVLDYLAEEVLQRQPEHIRSFLLQTSVLDRFCASLCNAVTTREDAKEILDTLERRNLFLIPLDDQRQWYRYHHLFAEVLQTHLLETQPEQVSILHQQASVWYERNGLRSDAIHHALAAKDFEGAAGLIELAGPTTEDVSIQSVTWLGWVKRLPEELIRARPVLNVWYAYALLGRGEMEAAESRLKDAEQWLVSADTIKAQLGTSSVEMVVVDKEQFKSLSATIAISRAYIAQTLGNIPDTVRYASRVLELTEADPFRHSQASMMLGLTHWASGDLETADRVFADYTMKLRTSGNIPDAISTSVVLADIRLALGHLHEAIITIEQLLQFVMDHSEPIYPATADLHRELSELYLEQGNLEAAAQHLQRSKELGEKAQSPVSRYRLCIDQARLETAQGNLEGALALLDEAQRLYIRSPLPDFCPISAMKARIWVAQGKLTKTLEWVREQGISVEDALTYLREFEHVTLARVLIARYKSNRETGCIHEAVGLLERLLHAAEEGKRMGSVIEVLALLALAHAAQGDIPLALVSLERALTLAEPEGYVRIFLDEGKPMAELLKRAGKNKPSFLEKQVINPQSLIEPLSENELEVLRLLRTELSGPEIARKRMVSLSTIRTHTQHIYAKLGVNNRRAAVRCAEELGLL